VITAITSDTVDLCTDSGGTWWAHTSSLRRLPAQPATEGKATAAPIAKVDPYAEHRREFAAQSGAVTDADVADLTAGYEAAKKDRRRFTADTLRDLDRPLTPPRYPTRDRGACLGVMGIGEGVKRREGKGAPSTWPEGSDHE
jgi:hypothetical protein